MRIKKLVELLERLENQSGWCTYLSKKCKISRYAALNWSNGLASFDATSANITLTRKYKITGIFENR